LDDIRGRSQLLRWVTWYWFFVATVTLIIGVRYPLVFGIPESAGAKLFMLTLSVGHWYSLFFLATVLLFYPLVLLLPLRRLIVAVSIILAVVVLSLVITDSFVFSLFRFHLNGTVFSLLLGDAADEVFVFDYGVYLTAAALLLSTIVVAYLAASLAWRMVCRVSRHPRGIVLGLSLLAVFMAENLWFAWADAMEDLEITSQAHLYPLYQPTRAQDFFVSQNMVNPERERKRVKLKTGTVAYPKQPLTCKPQVRKPDIYLIVLESWRYGETAEKVVPNIHRFSEQALQFTHHYSGGNNTRTGIFSIFYGLPATYWESFLDERIGAVFVDQLVSQQYDLAIYASAKLTSPEFDRTIFANVSKLRTQTMADGVYERDVRATDDFVQHVQETDSARPMFGFLFYDAPHSFKYDLEFDNSFEPAAPEVDYFELDNDTDPLPYLNLYRRSLRSVDKQLGRALAAIRKSGRWDHAIIIVTGDHSQEFNDNGLGFWGHNGNFTDAQIRVPLLIKWPGRERRLYDYTTTHYDLVPTLLQEALGCDNPPKDYSVGNSLFSAEERYGFVEGGFGDYAVRLRDRIYWIDKFGGTHVLSATNHELTEEPKAEVLVGAMEQISRFYK